MKALAKMIRGAGRARSAMEQASFKTEESSLSDPAKTTRDVREASKALADLNTFAAIVALLESGLNSSPTFAAAGKIIRIAKDEQQKCLRRYDAAFDRLIK